MKRSYRVARGGELETVDSMALALMILSHAGGDGREDADSSLSSSSSSGSSSSAGRVFECKTCSRQFPSFQALGGHRASHKKPKLLVGGGEAVGKPRVHECSVCGLEFAIGQALGGHMRRHRGAAAQGKAGVAAGVAAEEDEEKLPVPWLDLNVAPAEGGGDFVSCRKKIFGFEIVVDF